MFKTEGGALAPADRKQGNPNLAEVIRRAEERLQQLGPGPYSAEKQQVHDKLQAILQKTRAAQLQAQNALIKNDSVALDSANDSQSDSQSTASVIEIASSPPPAAANVSVAFASGSAAYTGVKYAVAYEQPGGSLPSGGYALQVGNSFSLQQVAHSVGGDGGGGNLRFVATQQARTEPSGGASATVATDYASFGNGNGSSTLSWSPLAVPAFEARSFDQLIRETDAQLQLEDDLEDAFVQLADDFVEQAVEYAIRIAKHRGASTIEAQDMMVALERYASQSVASLPQLGPAPAASKRRVESEAHRQRLALINKKFKKF